VRRSWAAQCGPRACRREGGTSTEAVADVDPAVKGLLPGALAYPLTLLELVNNNPCLFSVHCLSGATRRRGRVLMAAPEQFENAVRAGGCGPHLERAVANVDGPAEHLAAGPLLHLGERHVRQASWVGAVQW
jgi:hypothetical protein